MPVPGARHRDTAGSQPRSPCSSGSQGLQQRVAQERENQGLLQTRVRVPTPPPLTAGAGPDQAASA